MNASVHLIERVVGASAGLTVNVREAHPSVAILGAERSGSGTLVDASGLILTPNYVVVGAEQIEVTLVDGTVYTGQVVAQDFSSGLAVVKIDGSSPFPTVPLRSSAEATVGDEVFIVASAGGAQRRSHDGIITSLGPFDASWEYRLERAILTSAVNPGLGGGALFDLHGRMLGVVSLDLGEIGRFTLAVPAECFLEARTELLQSGRRARDRLRAWVGFFCYAHQNHVVIAGVFPGGPCDSAGLKPGDVVVALDGEKISGRSELYARVWSHMPGDRLTFSVFRDNEIKQIPVSSISVERFFA